MKVSSALYQLKPFTALNSQSEGSVREGALLKVEWPDGRTGYSDLNPWPELGDLPLEDHLSMLRQGKMSTQVEQSIWLASRDAHFRQQKKSIFDGLSQVKNNYLITRPDQVKEGHLDHIKAEGFNTLKIKMGRDLEADADFLVRAASKNFSLRLDMNGIGSWHIFEKFIKNLDPKALALVEYIEDPFPYEKQAWAHANSHVKIALDNQEAKVDWENLKPRPFGVVIIKPAVQDVDSMIERCQALALQATVTSYMGHPIGMMHSLAIAMDLKKKFPQVMLDPGCLTHKLFQMDSFAAEIPVHGPFISRAPGYGVGFDNLLEKQKWSLIKLH